MSSEGGKRAIIAALLANVGIAITKFMAWALSGSSAMLAEGVPRSRLGDQLLLLLGGRKSRRAPDREHPFGYGRERYIYAFIVAIVLFTVGGLFSIWEGISKIRDPHTIAMWWLPLVVLAIAIVLESFSLRTAVKESRPHKGISTWMTFIRRSKSPELPVILLEDFAALVGLVFAFLGVGLTALTGNTVFDASATILIGALLIAVAVVIGVENEEPAGGRGRDRGRREEDSVCPRRREGNRPDHPHENPLPRPGRVDGRSEGLSAGEHDDGEVSLIINLAERRIREAVPAARVIYIEPDVWLDPNLPTPTTSSIVMLSSD